MAFTNSHHTFKRFDTELDSLVSQVLEMARAAEQQVTRAVEACRTGNVEAAREVVATDDIINRRDIDIDRSCIRLLSRRQPNEHRPAADHVPEQGGSGSGAGRR